jgi:hypothetical protein
MRKTGRPPAAGVGAREATYLDDPIPGHHPDLPAGLETAFVRLYERALPLLATRSNDLHARVACQIVLAILQGDGGDPRVAVPAILLHDLGWHEIPETDQRRAYGPNSTDAELNRRHELAGARLARQVLEEEAYHPELVDEICRIIEGHDSRPEALTIEEAAVKDADKIYRITRVGFPMSLRYIGDLSPQELHDFIAVRAPRWFLTRTGAELAQRALAERREEYGLEPAPDVPPPPGFGIGDKQSYS